MMIKWYGWKNARHCSRKSRLLIVGITMSSSEAKGADMMRLRLRNHRLRLRADSALLELLRPLEMHQGVCKTLWGPLKTEGVGATHQTWSFHDLTRSLY